MSDSRKLPDHPAITGLLAAGGWSLFVIVRYFRLAAGNVGYFAAAGNVYTDSSAGLPLVDGTGYDGQFVHRLAIAPFATDERVAGTVFDSYAHLNRIGFPATARLFGAVGMSPATSLVVLNLFAALLLGLIGGTIAQATRRHAGWGLALPLFFGFGATIARDLTELFAATALIGGLWLVHRRLPIQAGAVLAIAALSRETTMFAIGGLALAEIGVLVGRRRTFGKRDVAWLMPTMSFIAWQLWAALRWGSLPLVSVEGRTLRFPGAALVEQIPTLLSKAWLANGWLNILHTAEVLVLLVIVVIALVLGWQRTQPSGVMPALVGAAVGMLLVDVNNGRWLNLDDVHGFAEVYVLAATVLLASRVRLVTPVAAVGACTIGVVIRFCTGV